MLTLNGASQRSRINHLDHKLTSDSIQEALRMYLQPIKNDDPLLDFYTMYKQETMEYDTDSMRKYDDDLNISLIFVRSCVPPSPYTLTTSLGRSVLRRQLRLRHRRPVPTPAGSHRTVRSLSPSNSPKPRSIHRPRRKPYGSSRVERPPSGGCRDFRPSVRKPSHVTVGCILRDAGQAMVEQVPPTRRRVDGRTVWRPPA